MHLSTEKCSPQIFAAGLSSNSSVLRYRLQRSQQTGTAATRNAAPRQLASLMVKKMLNAEVATIHKTLPSSADEVEIGFARMV